MRSGLDSLRAVVDTMAVRDSIAFRLIQETRREVAEQRDILLSTRATAGSTTQGAVRADGATRRQARRSDGPLPAGDPARHGRAQPGAADANQLYDQATSDLTQGRYALARRASETSCGNSPPPSSPTTPSTESANVSSPSRCSTAPRSSTPRSRASYPQGDKVPAALYKLALSQEKLGTCSRGEADVRSPDPALPAVGRGPAGP